MPGLCSLSIATFLSRPIENYSSSEQRRPKSNSMVRHLTLLRVLVSLFKKIRFDPLRILEILDIEFAISGHQSLQTIILKCIVY